MSTVVVPTLVEQDQTNAIIAWGYRDTSSGALIDPTVHTEKLFDPSEVQRDPANTANTTAATFVATKDVTGSVTGTAGYYYLTITDMDVAAELGLWRIESTFTHENVQKTQNICFNVVAAGAGVTADAANVTPTVYAAPLDVERFLLSQVSFDANSAPSSHEIAYYINMAEGEFERRTGTAYRPIMVHDELHDVEAWRQRHRDIFDTEWIAVPRPIHLYHRPVLPFDGNRGHRIEVYQGEEDTAVPGDPIRRWDDYVQTMTYGRDNDYWVDEDKGHLFIRKTFIFRRALAVRVTYEYGKPITTINTNIDATATTIPIASGHRYAHRGLVRIGDEWIFHTGKTPTALTGCTRGFFGSTAASHSQGDEVYEVPDGVRAAVTKYAAALYLDNEVFVTAVGDNAGTSPSFQSKIQQWKDDWETFITVDNQQWGVF